MIGGVSGPDGAAAGFSPAATSAPDVDPVSCGSALEASAESEAAAELWAVAEAA
jgi:hypothetical protein